MKAHDTPLRIFLEGTKQFIVPLFQRPYSWKKHNVKQLWEDLITTKDESDAFSHFFGSFVTMPLLSSASQVTKYTIIDGQQRIVTTYILLAAIRNRIVDIENDSDIKDEIYEKYLINKFDLQGKYKVVPTQADKDLFFRIIDEINLNLSDNHKISETYEYFKKELLKFNEIDDLSKLKDALLSKFSVVDITLEDTDDPYLIFESLNATGTPLTQADLIRNYLFMKISEEKQHQVYESIWFPMQQQLGEDLESFFRHYLAMSGDIPNFDKIYSTFKNNTERNATSEEQVIEVIKDLTEFAEYYNIFLNPELETNSNLRKYLEKLDRLEVTTSYPLLLKLYDDNEQDKLSDSELEECLKAVEVFVVRRSICGVPTNALNKYFPTMYGSLNQDDIVGSLKDLLKTGTGARRMPDDTELKEQLTHRKLFGNRILRYALEEIERFGNREVVNFENLQVEHIMPQTLSDEWKDMLGENWELIHSKYLDTIGNLTLTGYNQQYSNRSFIEKRDMQNGFRDSNLHINRRLATIDNWTEEQIQSRAQELSDIAVQIWNI